MAPDKEIELHPDAWERFEKAMTVIGTDGGLLAEPVDVDRFLIGPAERVDVVIDFSSQQGIEIVLTNDAPAPHPIQGIGAGFIPANLRTELLDGVIQVAPDDAKEWARQSAQREGLLVGISSGATLAAIAQKLPDLPGKARVLGFNYDTGERYLSVPDFLPEQ